MPFASRLFAVVVGLSVWSGAVQAAPRSAPKLVVVLVVDQMRGDYVDRYGHQWSGGLRRLITEGAWFRRAAYPYLTTVTCAGHATISTGAFPSKHGIVGNSWFDRETGRSARCADDGSARGISYADPVASGGSANRLRVPTLTDELRAQLPGPTRVVTFSMKERTAVMLAGHRADAATWFNPAAKGFVTSSTYSAAPVPFIAAALKAHPVAEDFGKSWTRLLPVDRYLFTDAATGEKPSGGWGWSPTFPHILKGKSDQPDQLFFEAWETSPFSDASLGRLAIASIDALKLGQGAGTDFLGVSFSALDLVGHDFGPKSHEIQDVLARLDQTIGALLTHLDRTVGAGNYVVALGGDHGVSMIPEQMSEDSLNAGRLDMKTVNEAIQKGLEAALGPGKYPVRQQNSDFYLEAATVEKLRRDPVAVESVLRSVRALAGVAAVYFGESLDAHAAAGDRDARAALLSYFPGRSGDIIVAPRPNWFYVAADGTSQPGDAASHGTYYAYDQHVPLLLYGAGIRRGEYLRAVSPADIAPTLAFLCGVTLPQPDGDVLVDALTPAPPTPAAAPALPKR
ncbi:MAG: alkaline phosphatase family protein [Acidobacteria bacterium]|nr:alkaline phosphatase family protein [Acidobacteriota bacterium]